MKKVKLILMSGVISIFFVACNNNTSTSPLDKVKTFVGGQKYTVEPNSSVIQWTGTKPLGNHTGTINIKEGSFAIKDSIVQSGSFVIDMNSILDQDIEDTAMKFKLMNHLKSADFFDAQKYPEATFNITKINSGKADSIYVSGNLKIKDVEKAITFAALASLNDSIYNLKTSTFTIDRTQWGIKYASKNFFKNLADKFIDDNIQLKLNINATISKQ